MKNLSFAEILFCGGSEFTPCFCHGGQGVKKYEGGLQMFKTIMCWHICCKIDKADAYQWGNEGNMIVCRREEL